MDIKHKMHKHPDGTEHKMQRLYKRIDKKFVPCAWMCTNCGLMLPD